MHLGLRGDVNMAQSASANATAGVQLPVRIATHLLVEQNFYDHRFSRCFEQAGELARAAACLGEAGINIDDGYCGVEPGTNATFLEARGRR